ncbi:MAG: S8 family serine peptidase [Bacteroidetes bacterium]|jgi:subtilisin family serine protease|nr:S8 family serine peptidase [Bacteroidota bacterium]MDF1863422.1 S8 family serine peptidase [Saprospiraceae bacterium]
MGKLTVKSGRGELKLVKSKKLVGLKSKKAKDLTKTKYVEKEHFKNLGGFQVVSLEDDGNNVDDQLDQVRKKRDIELGTHVYYAEGSNKPLLPTGEIYIIFETAVDEEELQIVLDEYALELVERRGDDRIIAKVTKNSPNPIKVANYLQQISLVKHAEPDIDTLVDEYISLPSDTLIKQQWHLKNDGIIKDAGYPTKKGADAKVVDAWNRIGNIGSSKVTIAVIDNGFDLTHPDLRDKIFRPWDLWTRSSKVSEGDPFFTHGTPCASIALASANGRGIVGVAPNAKFMPVSGTSFGLRATENMFDYCIKNGADIISCSWGSTDPRYTLSLLKEEAISKVAREGRNGKGAIVLYAAGNEGLDYINFYAAHPDVIAVGASDSRDRHSRYSNAGRELDVVAPSNGDWPLIAARAYWDEGTTIRGEGEWRWWADGQSRGDNYKHFGGTSASTPLVAGICALMLSANPDLTAKEVKDILRKTADKIGDPSEYSSEGHSRKYGYGRVNADRAVAEALRRRDGSQPVVEVEENISSGRGLFRFSVERQASEGWGVQIGAFAEYGNVLIQAEKLQRQFGEPVVVNINELNGKTVYKIVIGTFNNKEDARRLMNRMTDRGVRGFLRNLKDLK